MPLRPLVLAAALLVLLVGPAAAGAAAWGTPVEVAPSTMGDDPRGQIAELSNGDAVLVWDSAPPLSGTYAVYAAQRVDGTWSAPAPISAHGEAAEPTCLKVGADGAGGAIAVWSSLTDGASLGTARAARFADGAWSTPTTISDPTADSGCPVLAVGADGTASAAWPFSFDDWDTSDLALSTFDGDHWSTAATVPGTLNAGTPAIARSATGTTTLADPVWPVGMPSDPGTLYVQQLRADGWHDLGAASEAGDGFAGAAPALAAATGDAVILVWAERPSNSPPERARFRAFDGTAWGDAATLSTGTRPVSGVGIAIGGDGSGVATWTEDDDHYVQARRFDVGGWSPTEDDLTQDPLDRVQQVQPHVAADGTVLVAWNAITPTTGARMQSARWADGAWSALPEITPGSPDAWFGSAAIAPDGGGAIAWAEITHHDGASDTWNLMATQLDVPSDTSGGGDGGAGESGGTHRTPPIRVRTAASGPHGIALVLRATGPGRVGIGGTWSRAARSTRSTVICRGAKAVRRAGTVRITCAWTRAGRALLATRSLRIRVTATFRPKGGGAATTVTRWVRAPRLGPEPVTG